MTSRHHSGDRVRQMTVMFLFVGGFLSDAGWYGDAEKVFLSCLQLCTLHSEVLHCYRAVECCVRSVSKSCLFSPRNSVSYSYNTIIVRCARYDVTQQVFSPRTLRRLTAQLEMLVVNKSHWVINMKSCYTVGLYVFYYLILIRWKQIKHRNCISSQTVKLSFWVEVAAICHGVTTL